jgi:5-formyltetrahydrofolate cyclo-ligase
MEAEIKQAKKQLRTTLLAKRNAFSQEQKRKSDGHIQKQLLDVINAPKAQVVHTYLPMGSEVDLIPVIKELLHQEITVVCPKTLPKRQLEHRVLHALDELEAGPMGTFHPKEADVYEGTYDVIIVPGLAFDAQHYRLGYGGGYYDSFLGFHPRAVKVGAFYTFQKVAQVPMDVYDLPMDKVIVG